MLFIEIGIFNLGVKNVPITIGTFLTRLNGTHSQGGSVGSDKIKGPLFQIVRWLVNFLQSGQKHQTLYETSLGSTDQY